MKTKIGSYEAKTRLPELLRQVAAGKSFTITNRGESVADLVPSKSRGREDRIAAIDEFKKFVRENPIKGVNIRELIEEGRD